MVRRFRPTAVATAACLLAVPAAALAERWSFTPVRGNPADRMTATPIDAYAYDQAKRCTRRPKSGTLALQTWLDRNAGGTPWGIMRCSKLGPDRYSLHAEGRALDWHLNVHSLRDRREARRLIKLLLAPDRAGNQHALARRMGVQEIIWNCEAWWSGSPTMNLYSTCYQGRGGRYKDPGDTLAHRDHIHFGLNRRGAARRTTFWAAR